MVALGAAKAKQHKLDAAEQCLKKALRVDAETPNAAKTQSCTSMSTSPSKLSLSMSDRFALCSLNLHAISI